MTSDSAPSAARQRRQARRKKAAEDAVLKSAAEREPDVADVASSETSGTKRKSSGCTSVDEVCGDGAESSVDSGGGKGKSGDGGGGLGGVGNDGGGVEGVEDSDTKAREVPKRKRSRARTSAAR